MPQRGELWPRSRRSLLSALVSRDVFNSRKIIYQNPLRALSGLPVHLAPGAARVRAASSVFELSIAADSGAAPRPAGPRGEPAVCSVQ